MLLTFSLSAFSQTDSLQIEKKVDLFDKNRNIIKLGVKKKDIEKELKHHTGDTIYIQKKIDGKWWECKYVRRHKKFLI